MTVVFDHTFLWGGGGRAGRALQATSNSVCSCGKKHPGLSRTADLSQLWAVLQDPAAAT